MPRNLKRKTQASIEKEGSEHDSSTIAVITTPTKRRRTATESRKGQRSDGVNGIEHVRDDRDNNNEDGENEEEDNEEGSPTPRANGTITPNTPPATRSRPSTLRSPSGSAMKRADQSAKRKSVRILEEHGEFESMRRGRRRAVAAASGIEDDGGEVGESDAFGIALARKILEHGDREGEDNVDSNVHEGEEYIEGDNDDNDDGNSEVALEEDMLDQEHDAIAHHDSRKRIPSSGPRSKSSPTLTTQTPTRGRGRPKGSKNRRSPTPEGELPPEERYFFQNRAGPPEISGNLFTNRIKLLTHEEYYGLLREYYHHDRGDKTEEEQKQKKDGERTDESSKPKIKGRKNGHKAQYCDHWHRQRKRLLRLHARAFPQWLFEWSQGFSLCLYGWGSKRVLVESFAEWLDAWYQQDASEKGEGGQADGEGEEEKVEDSVTRQKRQPAKIVVVNGHGAPRSSSKNHMTMRSLLNTLIDTLDSTDAFKTALNNHRRGLTSLQQPTEILDLLLSHLTDHPPATPLILLVNSIDSLPLRRHSNTFQSFFARLASHPSVCFLATADTPHFPLLWDRILLDQFAFVFHDCTTYEPFHDDVGELNDVVDDVHALLGRKGQRLGGGEGVGFVLKSLTENSKKLYGLLLTEILQVAAEADELPPSMNDDAAAAAAAAGTGEDGELAQDRPDTKSTAVQTADIGIEYRTLYQKAQENFICSSEMNFRTLLKEFYDHQMIVEKKDALVSSGVGGGDRSGRAGQKLADTENLLSVPLSRDEMETLLEDLL